MNLRLILIAGAATACFFTGWWVNGLRWESKLSAAVLAKETEMAEKCTAAQKTTAEVSNEYQGKIRAINNRHAIELKRVRTESQCVSVTGAASRHDATASGVGLPKPPIVPAEDLLEIARLADIQTAQLLACQDFVRKERAH